MPTREAETGVGAAAKQVAEHASALARLELELARLELRHKAGAFGAGAMLAVGAALLAVMALGFAFGTIAAALATFMPTWLALLLVTTGIALLAGIAALLARTSIRQATPPVPEQAIREARLTTEAIKRNGSR